MTRGDEIRRAAGNVSIRDNKVRYEQGFLVKALLDAFTEGARWADRTMIGHACQWLQENLDDYLDDGVIFLVSDFKKAMQDESKDKKDR